MQLTAREIVATSHGIVLGGLFLLFYTGGLVGFWNLREENLKDKGVARSVALLRIWTLLQAVLAWSTALLGTFVVYPWYRAKPLPGADLVRYPQALLMANPSVSFWHGFGMEWKEHVAWFGPILATVVAYLVMVLGPDLARQNEVRRCCVVLSSLAFATAAIAGLLGAEITKVAPIR